MIATIHQAREKMLPPYHKLYNKKAMVPTVQGFLQRNGHINSQYFKH